MSARAARRPDNRVRERDFTMAVAERIREMRLARGLSQTDLADAIGVTYQQVHKYERGINRLTLDALSRLAGVFGMAPEDMIAGLDATARLRPARPDSDGLAHTRAYLALPPDLRPLATRMLRAVSELAEGRRAAP